MPQINVLGQYIKDLSFENPNAPGSFLKRGEKQPPLNVQINVNINPVSESDFNVELVLEAKAGEGADMLFNLELTYAGIFRVTNVAQEHLHPIVMIECPRLLFPFARQIIANCTQQGGFPPMMLDPIDFVSLYRQRMAQQQPAAAN
ncbi:MAG: protein-export chaperone SecB [Rhodobiaceae bacterium]|nr:protein-export chaperone SecB [Rhodobiaceae bacterium]MCC0055437.1 protein-export chaperone SecB [Rhodobiaceae bacterium]